MRFRYQDRSEAGQLLAAKLREYEGRQDVVILALPRGGVPVAFEVAERLSAPLDVFVVRKLGMPGHEEFAIGAIASGGATFINHEVIDTLRIPLTVVDEVIARERMELDRRERLYRKSDRPISVRDQVVILVDDGMATGASMRVASSAVRGFGPSKLIVAVPVGSSEAAGLLQGEADEVICLQMPEPFFAVGAWYDNFSQIGDEEIRNLLERATRFQQVIPA